METDNLPEDFNLTIKTTMTQQYIDSDASLYMYVELAEMFDQANANTFCLILDREFDLGILGTKSTKFTDIFNEFKIDDVPDYVSSMMGSHYSDAIDKNIRTNYL